MNKRANLWRMAFGAAALVFAGRPASAGDWANWRGPEQNGVSREKNLVDTFDPDTGENMVWAKPIPVAGMSSPIVMKGKLYTWTRVGEVKVNDTTIVGPQTQEALVCVDTTTGKQQWEYRINMTQTDVPFHRLGWGNVVGDPANGRVYGYGTQGGLVCLDGESGKVVWKHEMLEEYGMISTFGGRTPSPTVDQDQLIITGVSFGWGDNARGVHRVYAFDKATGKLNWTSGPSGVPVDAPYNTPVIAVVNGQRLVCFEAGDGGVYGVKARTGETVFGYKISKRGNNSTVLVVDNKLIASSGEENPDNAKLGRVVCLDIGTVDEKKQPKELWRIDGIEAGFASPTTDGQVAYIEDNMATIHAIDIETGKVLWKQSTGTIGKASVVYADGKLYVAEANGRFVVIKPPGPGQPKPKVLSKVELSADAQQLGREYFIFGSPAISNGRFYLQTAGGIYVFGAKTPVDTIDTSNPIPQLPTEAKADPEAAPAIVQVVPADVVLAPGESVKFSVRTFDGKGRLLKEEVPATFSISQLTMPPPPPPPGQPAAPATQPVLSGNLAGKLAADGTFTAEGPGIQGGGIQAQVKVGDKTVSGVARVRVAPKLPMTLDFEQYPEGRPPLTFVNSGGKFEIKKLADGNKVLAKVPNIDLYHAARTYFSDTRQNNYTIEADIMCGGKQVGDLRYIPDMGVINDKYSLTLYGNHQECMIISWSGALPKEGQLGSAILKRVPYVWSPDTWYHFKLTTAKEAGKTIVRGKVWKKSDKEPDAWTLELEDTSPNVEGSPGLYGESLVAQYKSEIYYDNVIVSENK